MKIPAPAPELSRVATLEPQRVQAILAASQQLDDTDYLHWEQLRHKTPPAGLSVEEWWLALKLKRSYGAIGFPTLMACNLQQLSVFRHARIEAGMARQVRNLLNHRQDLNHRQLALLDHAMRKPQAEYTHESHASSHRISIVTARSDLQHLVRLEWLEKVKRGKRFVYLPTPSLEQKLRRH